ncbi:MAG: hypothetical protein K2K45_01705 [Muribaculaceae bacterium]|nr:hypothetical protein [Muribaculaceae bacterium]
MQINRMTLAKGILSIAAVSVMTGCVDDKYDLTDIDTTSQFKVNNLTVPVELSKIKLQNVINIDDDDETIKKDTINKGSDDEKVIYSIQKSGNIDPTEFSLGEVKVAALQINPTNIPIDVHVPELPSIPNIPIPDLPDIDIDLPKTDKQSYEFKMENVNSALEVLTKVTTKAPIDIQVDLRVPEELLGDGVEISFKDIVLQLPTDLITDMAGYSKETGKLKISELPVVNGKATLNMHATGLDLGNKGKVENGTLGISGQVGVESGKISIKLKSLSITSGNYNITAEYHVSGFELKNFSGKINYDMDDIKINPISLNDLPDFLNNDKTNIIIDNPVVLITINNPVGQYGLKGTGAINLTSKFSNGSVPHIGHFTLEGSENKLALCSDSVEYNPPTGYTKIVIPGLRRILTNSKGASGLPENIEVSVSDLNFAGNVNGLPLGNLGEAYGDYNFTAPLALGKGSIIYYNTTEDGWGSDDLDKVNIYLLKVEAECTSELPVDIKLDLQPINSNGAPIAIKEIESMIIPANCKNYPVSLILESIDKKTPIKDFDGVIFEATIEQKDPNAPALGPDIEIDLNKLSITVSGDYTTDF